MSMTEEEFRKLVGEMREAQETFFKTKNRNDLRIAKDFERRVDRALEAWNQSLLSFE